MRKEMRERVTPVHTVPAKAQCPNGQCGAGLRGNDVAHPTYAEMPVTQESIVQNSAYNEQGLATSVRKHDTSGAGQKGNA